MQTPFDAKLDSHATHDTDALTTLHNRTRDAISGFETMAEKAEPSFRPVVEKFLALHRHHADTLAGILHAKGAEVDPDGTLMGKVNELVVTVRAFFDDIDADTLVQIRDGEDWLLQAFDTAIAHEADPAVIASLHAMREDLAQMVAGT